MELLQLKYFCDAAKTENFSHTAKHFLLPPSAISQSVRRLEEELGVALFIRRANSITLSPEGRIFYEGARVALDSLDSAVTDLRDRGERVTGEIRMLIGCNRRSVFSAIEQYRRSMPDVTFILNHGAPADPSQYDIIIGDGYSQYSDMIKRLLVREKLLLAVPKTEGGEYLRGSELSSYRDCGFITMNKGASLSRLTESVCESCGFLPNVVIRSDDPDYIRKYLDMGMGVAIVPEYSWRGMFSERIELLDVGEYYRDTYVFSHNRTKKPICVRLFEELLISVFEAEQ